MGAVHHYPGKRCQIVVHLHLREEGTLEYTQIRNNLNQFYGV